VVAVPAGRSAVQRRAEAVADQVFVGGPVTDFDLVGRLQLITLLREGLQPESKVLDVGCGALRAGYWLIRLLEPGNYYGIEPARDMLEAGIERIVGRELINEKSPSFAHNDDWDFSVFGTRFEFVVARSIWTHASKADIATMLDSFVATAEPGARMLASYLPSGRGQRDYEGDRWVGRSHVQTERGLVYHRADWVRDECRARGLTVTELPGDVVNQQRWLRIVAPA
jgi:SAM-dependent methyltransferase